MSPTDFSALGLVLTWFLMLCQFVTSEQESVSASILITLEANIIGNTSFKSGQLDFKLGNLSAASDVSFVIFQVHSWQEPVTLSLHKEPQLGDVVTGCHIAMVTLLKKNQSECSWYLFRNNSQGSPPVKVVFLATLYKQGEPVPGACNIEFQPEDAPTLQLRSDGVLASVGFAMANVGLARGARPKLCDDKTAQASLSYDMYAYYVSAFDQSEDGYFEALKLMMLQSNVETYGRKVEGFGVASKMLALFNAFSGRGVLYTVVVTQSNDGAPSTHAAYVPSLTYGCPDGAADCSGQGGPFGAAVAVLIGLLGIALCFIGHRYFKTAMFIFGLFGLLLVAFILVARYSPLSVPVTLVVALLLGAIGGALWWTLWYYKGIPVVSVLLVGLVAGFLLASLVFTATPLGNILWLRNSFNYGVAFACSVVVLPVCLLAATKVLNIFSCAFVGGYLLVFAADLFLRGSVKEILLVSVYKAVSDDLRRGTVVLPWTPSDIVLLVTWGLLVVGGVAFQWWRERKKPPFPPCPWLQKQMRASLRIAPPSLQRRVDGSSVTIGNSGSLADDEANDDDDDDDDFDNADDDAPLIHAQRETQRQYEEYLRQREEAQQRQQLKQPEGESQAV